MAVFGVFKRKATKEDSDKQPQQNEEPAAKYHHVPTHAASDALMGAPAGWNRDDVTRIREANRRRSAMDAHLRVSRPASSASMLSPMHMGMGSSTSINRGNYGSNLASSSRGGFSRSTSGLSQVSYPPGPSNPVVQSRSFNSMDAEMHRGNPASAAPTGPLPPVPTTNYGQANKDTSYHHDASYGSSSNSSSSSHGDGSRGDVLEMRALRKPNDNGTMSGDGSTSYYYNQYASQGLPATNLNAQQQQPQQHQPSASYSRSSSAHTLVTSSTSSNNDTPPLPSGPFTAESRGQTAAAVDLKTSRAVSTVDPIDENSVTEPEKAVVHEPKVVSPVVQKTHRLLPTRGLSFRKGNWPFQNNSPAAVSV